MSKTVKEIYNSMKESCEVSLLKPIEEDSRTAKILEALSTELYGLYCYADYIKNQAFVQTATGENLDRLAQLRGIERKREQKSSGRLTFYLSEPATAPLRIQQGIVCSVSGKPYLQYVTTSEAYIAAGNTSVSVPAQAISAGAVYNVYPDEIDVMVIAPVGVEGVYNENAFTGGYDNENDESLRMRVIERYAHNPCGISRHMLESTVMGLEFVTDCFIPVSENGRAITAYVSTKNGELTNEQIDEVKQALSISELAGATVQVVNSSLSDFSISVRLKVRASYDKETIEQRLREIVNTLYANCRIGCAFSLGDIEKRALLIDGVLDASAESDEAMGDTVYCDYDKKLNITDLAVSCYEA